MSAGEFEYEMINPKIQAVRWDGINREPIIRFVKEVLGEDEDFIRFTADEETGEKYDNYNMVKFFDGCDGLTADPGQWITYREGSDECGNMYVEEFQAEFRKT